MPCLLTLCNQFQSADTHTNLQDLLRTVSTLLTLHKHKSSSLRRTVRENSTQNLQLLLKNTTKHSLLQTHCCGRTLPHKHQERKDKNSPKVKSWNKKNYVRGTILEFSSALLTCCVSVLTAGGRGPAAGPRPATRRGGGGGGR